MLTNADKGMEKSEPSQNAWKMLQLLWKILLEFRRQLNTELPYEPEVPLLGIYPGEMKTPHRNLYTHFVAALFIITKRGTTQISFN